MDESARGGAELPSHFLCGELSLTDSFWGGQDDCAQGEAAELLKKKNPGMKRPTTS